jgi:hypothetical protein
VNPQKAGAVMRPSQLSQLVLLSSLLVANSCTHTTLVEPKNQEIQNLRAFGKLYGYVKYFHPSDQSHQIDWEKFAVYGSEAVRDAHDSKELRSTLEELFLPIAPTMQIYLSHETPKPISVPENVDNLKIVAWQHQGVGLGTSGPIYKSIRTNRVNHIPQTQFGFATASQSVDATQYRGKSIRLKAFVRTNVTGAGNHAQLWLRVDRQNEQVGFLDNMDDRPINSSEWHFYEIVGDVPNDATNIYFGCLLNGIGQIWVDEFSLSVRNDLGDWENIQIPNSGFEERGVKKPTMWSATSPGYSYEAVNDKPYAGERCLRLQNMSKTFSGTLFEGLPKPGEVITAELAQGVSCQIPLALYSESNGKFDQQENTSLDALLSKLSKIETTRLTADNQYVRLGNIIIAWNVFKHFYPYFNEVGTDWEAEFTDVLEDVLSDRNERDFLFSLSRMVARLHDGHGRIEHRIFMEQTGFPFLLDWIEKHLVITFSGDTSRFRIGDIIVSIDGIPAKQMLLDEEEFISGSPQWKRVQSLRRFGFGKEGTTAKLRILRNGDTLKIEVMREPFEGALPVAKPNVEEIADNIFYVNLIRADMTEIGKRLNELAGAKGVIFDMRGYPNGNDEIISHLLTEPDTSGEWMRVPQIIYPDQENVVGFTKYGWYLQPKQPHLRGKIMFLTDARAKSYAESIIGFVEHYKLGEIVGQQTAGANGNVNAFELPGGFRVSWTGMRVVKHDGSQHHLIGIKPTVRVQRTIRGLIEGKDEFLEKALELINGGW